MTIYLRIQQRGECETVAYVSDVAGFKRGVVEYRK